MTVLTNEARGRVERVLARAVEDIGFREELISNPAEALSGEDLTDEERELLTSMKRVALEEWGIDVRASRTFLMDNGWRFC